MQLPLGPQTNRKSIEYPPIFAIDTRVNGNKIQQVLLPPKRGEVTLTDYDVSRVKGQLLQPLGDEGNPVLLIANSTKPPRNFQQCLRGNKLNAPASGQQAVEIVKARWVKHPLLQQIPSGPIDYASRSSEATKSWLNSFSYRKENANFAQTGLRSPQIGAVHAIHAHWSVSNRPATIVIPTGVGKTETMLSVLISEQCSRLIVIAPTDALRTQLAAKFLSLGVLKDFGVVTQTIQHPIVGILKHRPRTIDEVNQVFEKCNVIVTTMDIAGQSPIEVQKRMAELCPYLFIDEACCTGHKAPQNSKNDQ